MENDDVVDAIGCIVARKSDASGLSSEHLKLAAPVISAFVSALFYCYSETWLYVKVLS